MLLCTLKRSALSGLVAASLLSASAVAQKVDLDRFHFEASYLQLPREYVEPASRTFGVRVNSSPAVSSVVPETAIYDQLKIFGFQKTEISPTVGITVNFGDVRFEKSETMSRTEERKDKDGKVTSRVTYYSIKVTYSANGSYKVVGPKAELVLAKKAEDEKPKEVKTNRFMTAVQKTDEAAAPKAVQNGSLSQLVTYTTQEYTSLTDASRYMEQNQASIRTNLINDYVNQSIRSVNYSANSYYGYVPTKTREHLWILDSKKHPEYEVQQEAIKAVKELMQSMSATESLETLAQNLQPVMDYFQTLKTKYAGDDKQNRKMRYSAYYNLAALNYLLDRPAKTMEEADGLIKNEYDTSDGKKYVELAEELKKDLDKHKMDARHMKL